MGDASGHGAPARARRDRPAPRAQTIPTMAIPFDLPLAHLLAMTASVIAGALVADSVETSGRRWLDRARRFLGGC